MNVAIMQPYLLPYIGYFQLLEAADVFVVLDDVHYINRGWINRNRLLLDGAAQTFTVPLVGASQNRIINELELVPDERWRMKLLRTVKMAYRAAPEFEKSFPLIQSIFGCSEPRLAPFLLHSLESVKEVLRLDCEIVPSASRFENCEIKGAARILDICRRLGATRYVNPIGGLELYDSSLFEQAGIELRFLKARPTAYPQFKTPHIPFLSILDVLMFNGRESVADLLTQYDLVSSRTPET
ncbi:WbqC family protein [soil metagenome]